MSIVIVNIPLLPKGAHKFDDIKVLQVVAVLYNANGVADGVTVGVEVYVGVLVGVLVGVSVCVIV
jgi:hypothetical protein